VLLGRVAVLFTSLKPIQVGRSDRKGKTGEHPADSRAASAWKIVRGIQPSYFIHYR
jgi:hypothetical protein